LKRLLKYLTLVFLLRWAAVEAARHWDRMRANRK